MEFKGIRAGRDPWLRIGMSCYMRAFHQQSKNVEAHDIRASSI